MKYLLPFVSILTFTSGLALAESNEAPVRIQCELNVEDPSTGGEIWSLQVARARTSVSVVDFKPKAPNDGGAYFTYAETNGQYTFKVQLRKQLGSVEYMAEVRDSSKGNELLVGVFSLESEARFFAGETSIAARTGKSLEFQGILFRRLKLLCVSRPL